MSQNTETYSGLPAKHITAAEVTYAPDKINTELPTVFLAGSIEMGKAKDWQKTLEKLLKDFQVMLLNPRREDWDSSWEQTIENDQFREQVEWELDSLEKADLIVLYLDPETQSPISLLELGLHARSGKLIVCCPEGFYRKGNVDIVCNKYKVPMVDSLESLAEKIKELS